MKNGYEANIGIEVHVQLKTKTKIFCSSPNCISESPNINICPVCAGYPGVLPVLNEEVVNYAIMLGLATNCTINQENEFARKHYFYPDLPKNYQISQSDKPICLNGYIPIRLEDGTEKNIKLIRIHMEEDAGKNFHVARSNESFVDLNRTGTPLLEVVSHPDIASSEEAKLYLKALYNLVVYLDICTGNMEEGAFRADTNVSVKKIGATQLGTRCELKNINSFKFISDAVEYEIDRQIDLIESGQKVSQETRSWDTKEHKTFTLRSKEESADYRYFPDPDLPILKIDQTKIDSIKNRLPELPEAKFKRLCEQYNLKPYESEILVNDKELGEYYEKAAKISSSKNLINWILREIINLSKEQNIKFLELKITPEKLAKLVNLIDEGVINNKIGQEVFIQIDQTGKDPEIIVKESGLEQIGSTEELEKLVLEVIKSNPKQLEEYKSGKDKLFGFFVGKVMEKSKGKGNPQIVTELLKKYL